MKIETGPISETRFMELRRIMDDYFKMGDYDIRRGHIGIKGAFEMFGHLPYKCYCPIEVDCWGIPMDSFKKVMDVFHLDNEENERLRTNDEILQKIPKLDANIALLFGSKFKKDDFMAFDSKVNSLKTVNVSAHYGSSFWDVKVDFGRGIPKTDYDGVVEAAYHLYKLRL